MQEDEEEEGSEKESDGKSLPVISLLCFHQLYCLSQTKFHIYLFLDDGLSADSDDESLSSSSDGSSSSASSSSSEDEEGERPDSEGPDTMDDSTIDSTTEKEDYRYKAA